MDRERRFETGREQAGSALLIAIFALLLISVVGIALLLSTGSDSALAGNYRTSTAAYYAAVAGLEEGRGRLNPKNQYFLGKSFPTLFSVQGTPAFGRSDLVYLLNPAGGETVDPTNPASPYADTEYITEFGVPPSAANVQTAPSFFLTSGQPLPGPAYKWIRITAVTENALGFRVDSNPAPDPTAPLSYNGTSLTTTPSPNEALEVTALAFLPDGSKRLLQYVVAQPAVGAPAVGLNGFPSALTLVGNNVTFQGPGTSSFFINGQDQISTSGCSGTNGYVDAIGFTSSQPGDNSQANIQQGAVPPTNYSGAPYVQGPSPGPTTPSISNVGNALPPNWQTVGGLDSIVQTITSNADVVLPGPATGNDISNQAGPAVSGPNAGPNPIPAATPMTIVVNGDLNLTSWHQTGYGLLLVTGTLTYDPDASWEGVVLVIGQGQFISTKGGTGGIDGELLIAQIRDASGNLLPSLGSASFSQTDSGWRSGWWGRFREFARVGRGINYSSCLVASAQSMLPFKALSFREIPQTN